ncbi:hypothetical protein CVD28_04095 [Bacillus sp. M6-12]|nr:hypothetical protein CVD28_04095 [Bacillus sp. M6-12]
MLILDKEQRFEVNKEKKIGHMRCDFADGRLANKWFPTELASKEGVNLKEIQNIVNAIMFEEITTFDKVIELCEGLGYDNTSNRFVYEGEYHYWINLVPVAGDYNYYIHVYEK